MRFLRLQRLMRASDVLQLLKIVKSRTTIHLTWAASVVATVWTCGACVFYMVKTHYILDSSGQQHYSSSIVVIVNLLSASRHRCKNALEKSCKR